MQTKEFGLPLEYQQLPEYFDAHNLQEDTDTKNAVIEKLLKEHGAHSVLDLTCGTGSQVFFLTKHGYQVTGADFSPALLEQARARASRENLPLTFIDGDMRTLVAGSFDAAITIFNAIGHLTKADFEKALRNINRNLKNGGIYIFDIFNRTAMTPAAVADLAWLVHKKVGDSQLLSIQCSTLDQTTGILTSHESYLIQQAAGQPQRLINTFSLQLYTATELDDLLARTGFKTLARHAMDGSPFIGSESQSILTVARKR